MQETQETWFRSWVGKIPWSRKWQPTPLFLPGRFHGQRSLVGYSPWGHKESDLTERERAQAHTHTHGWESFVGRIRLLLDGGLAKGLLDTAVSNWLHCLCLECKKWVLHSNANKSNRLVLISQLYWQRILSGDENETPGTPLGRSLFASCWGVGVVLPREGLGGHPHLHMVPQQTAHCPPIHKF